MQEIKIAIPRMINRLLWLVFNSPDYPRNLPNSRPPRICDIYLHDLLSFAAHTELGKLRQVSRRLDAVAVKEESAGRLARRTFDALELYLVSPLATCNSLVFASSYASPLTHCCLIQEDEKSDLWWAQRMRSFLGRVFSSKGQVEIDWGVLSHDYCRGSCLELQVCCIENQLRHANTRMRSGSLKDTGRATHPHTCRAVRPPPVPTHPSPTTIRHLRYHSPAHPK